MQLTTTLFLSAATALASVPAGKALFRDDFKRPDGVVCNEQAHRDPSAKDAVASADWDATSGVLRIEKGLATDGPLTPRTAVFRLVTRQAGYGDVAVSFRVLDAGLGETKRTPETEWDGLHVMLRYQSQYQLYYASVSRRDNTVIVKKKTPGGPSNGGTYHNLTRPVPYKVPYGKWQEVRATVRNQADGSVAIELSVDGKLLLRAVDDGTQGGPPISKPGKVGLRADNCEFKLDWFEAAPLS